MTSAAYLKIEVQTHSALATVGRIRGALGGAGAVLTHFVYLTYQAFRIWRKMRTLAAVILSPERFKPEKVSSDDEVRHTVTLMRELHDNVQTLTRHARENQIVRVLYGPVLPAIERDANILGSFLDDCEMKLSPEFQASLQKAISELKPPTGTDWRASLEAMRH